MQALMALLSGKKSYLLGIALGLLSVTWYLDGMLHDDLATPQVTETTWLTSQQYEMLGLLLGGGSVGSLRAGQAKKFGA